MRHGCDSPVVSDTFFWNWMLIEHFQTVSQCFNFVVGMCWCILKILTDSVSVAWDRTIDTSSTSTDLFPSIPLSFHFLKFIQFKRFLLGRSLLSFRLFYIVPQCIVPIFTLLCLVQLMYFVLIFKHTLDLVELVSYSFFVVLFVYSGYFNSSFCP